jgi:hypothetical protein
MPAPIAGVTAQSLLHAAEIVVSEVERYARFVIRDPLYERVRQA